MKAEYEAVPLEQAQQFWQERNRVLRARSEALVIALVGKNLALDWWASANKAFEGQTPLEQFDRNPERVYSYLMQSADGQW
jgi:hypothetical protein